MRWWVEVKIEDNDFEKLSQILELSDIHIEKKENYIGLWSHQWDDINECKDFKKHAKSTFSAINGIAKLLLDFNHPINSNFNKIGIIDKEGIWKTSFKRSLTEITVRHQIPRTFKDKENVVEMDPATFFPKYLDLVMNNNNVKYVTKLVDFGFDDWRTLYTILEVIEDDMNGYENVTWLNKGDRKRFRGTSQDRDLVGLHARHGDIKVGKMKNPMTLGEARIFIWNAIIGWLNNKNTNSKE